MVAGVVYLGVVTRYRIELDGGGPAGGGAPGLQDGQCRRARRREGDGLGRRGVPTRPSGEALTATTVPARSEVVDEKERGHEL